MLLGTATVVLKGVHLMSIVGNAGTFQQCQTNLQRHGDCLPRHLPNFLFLGLSTHSFFFSVLLFDVVYREESLINVQCSVTRNGRSIVLTVVLALILGYNVYMFSIIEYLLFSFIFFKRD
jgi:hypothetical protein